MMRRRVHPKEPCDCNICAGRSRDVRIVRRHRLRERDRGHIPLVLDGDEPFVAVEQMPGQEMDYEIVDDAIDSGSGDEDENDVSDEGDVGTDESEDDFLWEKFIPGIDERYSPPNDGLDDDWDDVSDGAMSVRELVVQVLDHMATHKETLAAGESMWRLLKSLLPSPSHLPKFNRVKTLLTKYADTRVRKIECCPNGCLAYYNAVSEEMALYQHEHRTHCPYCLAARTVCGTDGKEVPAAFFYYLPVASFCSDLYRRFVPILDVIHCNITSFFVNKIVDYMTNLYILLERIWPCFCATTFLVTRTRTEVSRDRQAGRRKCATTKT
jgi:hypothetical protein